MRHIVIRLRRTGRKNYPSFDLVAAVKKRRVGGAFYEKLGFYVTAGERKLFFVNLARLALWLSRGAKVSWRAGSLFAKLGNTLCKRKS